MATILFRNRSLSSGGLDWHVGVRVRTACCRLGTGLELAATSGVRRIMRTIDRLPKHEFDILIPLAAGLLVGGITWAVGTGDTHRS